MFSKIAQLVSECWTGSDWSGVLVSAATEAGYGQEQLSSAECGSEDQKWVFSLPQQLPCRFLFSLLLSQGMCMRCNTQVPPVGHNKPLHYVFEMSNIDVYMLQFS